MLLHDVDPAVPVEGVVPTEVALEDGFGLVNHGPGGMAQYVRRYKWTNG